MQIITNRKSIILKEKVKLNVSVTKHKTKKETSTKKSIAYKINVPRIMLDPIIKTKIYNNNICSIRDNGTGYELFTSPFQRYNDGFNNKLNKYGIAGANSIKKNKTNYSIYLTRDTALELLIIDKYLKELHEIKERKPIYVYLRLQLHNKYNMKFSFKFGREWSGNNELKQIKRAMLKNPDFLELMASNLIRYNDKFDINEILKYKDIHWTEL